MRVTCSTVTEDFAEIVDRYKSLTFTADAIAAANDKQRPLLQGIGTKPSQADTKGKKKTKKQRTVRESMQKTVTRTEGKQ
jgi:hypothetical protein